MTFEQTVLLSAIAGATIFIGLPVGRLVDGALVLPEATGGAFWLDGSAWEYPAYENADVFLARLARRGLLVRDPVVEDALKGHTPDRSARTVQRRVLRLQEEERARQP